MDTYDAFPIHLIDVNLKDYFQTDNLLSSSYKNCSKERQINNVDEK